MTACQPDQQADVRLYESLTALGENPVALPGSELTLVDAVRLTNAFNERLAIEGEAYIQALAERQRRAARLRPTLDLFGDLTLREHTGSAAGSSGRVARFDGGIEAQYDLLTGLSDFRSVESAEATARARRWLVLDLREALLLETARSYYNVLRAERQIDVLESSMTVQAERLREIRARQAVGFARPLDVAQIEAQVSETRVALLDAQNQLGVARATLAQLTGVPLDNVRLTDGFEPAQIAASTDELLAGALARRQDLFAARADADAARADVDAAFGQYFPAVSLELQYFLVRDTSPNDLDLASLISINLPLFSAGRIEADVRDAWSVFRERVLLYAAIRRQVKRDIEVGLIDYEASRQRLDELGIQVAAAADALRQSEAAYAAGLGTNLERVTAQDQLLRAQLRIATEQFLTKLTYLSLLRAGGALSEQLAGATLPTAEPDERVPPTSPFVRTAPALAEPATDPPAGRME